MEHSTSTPLSSPPPSKLEAVPKLDASEQAAVVAQDTVPPPVYGEAYGELGSDQDELATGAHLGDDGRVNIRINQKTKGLSSLLVPALRSQLDLQLAAYPSPLTASATSTLSSPAVDTSQAAPPPLNLVIQIVGSRGDVQPFIALGKVLKDNYGHRVRLATHTVFRQFVEENGLEFFDIGGDPSELMAFMVKNPGLMPGFDALRSGDVGKRRREIATMIKGCWRSCIEAGNGTGIEVFDKNVEDWSNYATDREITPEMRPFVADAIIANPPSFAHVHCAEKLGIPLHMMFTMPWSPTQAFPHPLGNIQSSNADAGLTNYLSYALVETMTWQGLGDIINQFRINSLGLEPVSLLWAPGMLARMKIPWTYCWSPALIPKPRDWGSHISISGFNFLSLGSSFQPDPELSAFLAAGAAPIYIGFGSIVVDDPDAMTKLIFDAVKITGQRALVSKGWGGLGAQDLGIPEGVFMLGNTPHDWLFQRVSCVVHHGGAGTTAAGIAAGRPTVIVPFFGDQAFWGSMVAKAGAGPLPVPYKDLTAAKLAASIREALKPGSLEKAKDMSKQIEQEDGVHSGAQSFHKALDLDKLRCVLCPQRPAAWRLKRTAVRLSAFAVAALLNEGLIETKDIKLYQSMEYEVDDGPWDPITGGALALLGTTGNMTMGVADLPVKSLKALGIFPGSQKDGTAPKSARSSRRSSRAATLIAKNEKTPVPVVSSEPIVIVSDADAAAHATPDVAAAGASAVSPNPVVDRASNSGTDSSSVMQGKDSNVQGSLAKVLSGSRSRASSASSFDMEALVGTGRSVQKIVGEGLKYPLAFTLSLAQGFHNAPKLYGDETVRTPDKVTGLSSGLKMAGKQFGYGLYDGITGLVTQPLAGARKEGTAGFFKGFGKGLAGIVLKPQAGFWAIPGYTMQGMYRELSKAFGPGTDSYITASRLALGFEDLGNATEEERQTVVARWREMRTYLRKTVHPHEEAYLSLKQTVEETKSRARALSRARSCSRDNSRPTSQQERYEEFISPEMRRLKTYDSMDTGIYSFDDDVSGEEATADLVHANRQTSDTALDDDAGLEEAIRRSILETSRGNSEEDASIERAIRASVAEIEAARSRGADEKELRDAMKAQIEAAVSGGSAVDITTESTDSKGETFAGQNEDAHGANMTKALAESQQTADELENQRQEEDIVMRYMIKQSLVEEQMRKKADSAPNA